MPTPAHHPRQKPLLSFCIATHNRGPILLDCLHKILANGLPQNQFEILIVDNASSDSTPDLITQEFPPTKHPNLHLFRLPKNRGPVAKNVAIAHSKAPLLLLLDDDAYPHPGATAQLLRHFREDPKLGAAVFDVTLPDGSKESSAYPDAFIGAGTALRREAIRKAGGPLPHEFFMQAEEYDLSLRLLAAGYSIQRFWDLPLTHLKSPGARIGQRTTALDIRNNLYLLAKYIPDPFATQFAADWLARYFLMALSRDDSSPPHPQHGTHKQAYLRGAAQGLAAWSARRANGQHLLSPAVIERFFKFEKIQHRLAHAKERLNARRIIFADFGKNIRPYYDAALALNLHIDAIIDNTLAPTASQPPRDYRGTPILPDSALANLPADAMIVVTNMSPIHGPNRAAALRRTLSRPVLDLFSRQDPLLHGLPAAPTRRHDADNVAVYSGSQPRS